MLKWKVLQELMNILWAFVKCRFVPHKFLAGLSTHLAQEDVAQSLRPSDWAALVWGSASLGVRLPGPAIDSINEHGAQCLVEMTPAELCNMLW